MNQSFRVTLERYTLLQHFPRLDGAAAEWYAEAMNNDETPTVPPAPVAPANDPLSVVPTTIVPAGEGEVISMLSEQARFTDEPETRALAARLLEAGYSVAATARRLGLRASTVWSWASDPEMTAAVKAGQARRQAVLGQGLEDAAEAALSTLVDVALDTGAAPRDRVKASEAILDRCGITPANRSADAAVEISVDVDFDERLARIVAGSKAGA